MNVGGWTCGSCGSWVPNGVSHTCVWQGAGAGTAYKADPTWMLIQALNAATAELSRIAVALEKAGEKA